MVPYMSEASRQNLREAAEGAMDALEKLGSARLNALATGHIEVIRISLASWAPSNGHVYVQMVLNDGVKKEDAKALVYDPIGGNVRLAVEQWVYSSLNIYLAKLLATAVSEQQEINEKLEGLKDLLPKT